MKLRVFLIFLLLHCIRYIKASSPCQARIYQHGSPVCVCNESYCDTQDPISRSSRGVVQIFESNQAGKRLEKRQEFFGKSNIQIKGHSWKVTLNKTGRYQEIIGFGGSFSDAAGISIGSLPENLQKTLLSSYFSENGIEYSMGRSVIAGCDFSNRNYTYDDTEWDWKLEHWELAEEDTSFKIPQMKMAENMSRSGVKFFASSWSPPAWLKSSGKLTGDGTLNEGHGSIFWKTYAKYLLKYFDTYKENGINWWGMTVQNEPGTGFEKYFPWNTCGFTPAMERDFVKIDLGPLMEVSGYPPENFSIMVLDHNRNQIEEWTKVILRDAVAAKYVKGVAVHWYGNSVVGPEIYDQVHKKHPNHFILATEACNRGPDGDRIALGKWELGEEYAHDIITDLTHWVVGWLDWNLALDIQGGPNWIGNYHSAPIIVNATAKEFYKNTQFYAMAHFSKFLPPGSVRIATNHGQLVQNDKFQLAAFLRPDGGIVVIAINSWPEMQFVTLQDPELGELKVKIHPRSFNSWLYYY